jgi:hypothetical protein
MSISNIKLQQICSKHKIPLNGIFMKDQLDEIEPQTGNYIINLQSSTQGSGTHWLNLILHESAIYYQDSFGVIYPVEVMKFIHRFKKEYDHDIKVGHNRRQIQDLKSDRCGWFCLGLLYFVKQSNENLFDSCNAYINMFSDDLKLNDQILMKYLHENKIK